MQDKWIGHMQSSKVIQHVAHLEPVTKLAISPILLSIEAAPIQLLIDQIQVQDLAFTLAHALAETAIYAGR